MQYHQVFFCGQALYILSVKFGGNNMLTVGQKEELTQKLNRYDNGNCPLSLYRAYKILILKANIKDHDYILINAYNKLKEVN